MIKKSNQQCCDLLNAPGSNECWGEKICIKDAESEHFYYSFHKIIYAGMIFF